MMDENDEFVMKNPNLYIELAPDNEQGYLLLEDGTILLIENGVELFY